MPKEINYATDFKNLKEGKSFAAPFIKYLAISGSDAADFLQRLSTTNIPKLSDGELNDCAFLNGKGNLVSLGWLQKNQETFYFFTFQDQIEAASNYLNQMHFSEKLTISAGDHPISGRADFSRENFQWSLEKSTFEVSERAFEFCRRLFLIPRLHFETSPHQLFLESNFSRAISENKGCYPGQEVVERVKSYGRVNRLLLRLEVTGDVALLEKGQLLQVDGKNVGTVETWDWFPSNTAKALALGFVHRDFLQYSSYFQLNNEKIKAKIASKDDLKNF